MSVDKITVLDSARSALFNDHFEIAENLYRDYHQQYAEDPAGMIGVAATRLAQMSDREENIYGESFRRLTDSLKSTIDTLLHDARSPRDSAWLYLFRGHATAYASLWESRFGSFVSAVKTGIDARKDYERGLEADSTLYDLYFGLGSYHYWKSAKGGVLRFFGILKNEKDKGIRELYLAADSAVISREQARSALIWIYLDQGEYDSTITIAREFTTSYPDGTSFLWPIARAYFESERYDSAVTYYQQIREQAADDPGNYRNLITLDFHIARCWDKLDNAHKAAEAARQVYEYWKYVPEETRSDLDSKIARLERWAKDNP